MNQPSNQARTKRLSPICIVFYLLAAVSAGLYIAFRCNSTFADWFNQNISVWGRRIFAYATVIFPFSVAELLVCLIPLILITLIVVAYKHYCDSWRTAMVFVGRLLCVLAIVGSIFVWNFAPGYFGTTLDHKLGLDRQKVSKEELAKTAEILAEELNSLSDHILFLADGTSLMPYSYDEMNQKLLLAYESFCQKQTFMETFYSKTKPVMMSEPMSYTHITGVYTFFTGEANINVNFPDYTIPFTAAHELAHQRGISREDEANFVAFLVCMESDDPYIRYSGYLSVFEYVSSALYTADKDTYRQIYNGLPKEIRAEEVAYNKFFEKYRKNVAASVSQSVNNNYLISQGASQGTKSYNMVVDLAVAYYKAVGN
ncbi:MAG: DUF3810 domain-containing protein [Clostridia bacterium]|nr:DUF3810 domain-containing protein [Clostridia bacterium]